MFGCTRKEDTSSHWKYPVQSVTISRFIIEKCHHHHHQPHDDDCVHYLYPFSKFILVKKRHGTTIPVRNRRISINWFLSENSILDDVKQHDKNHYHCDRNPYNHYRYYDVSNTHIDLMESHWLWSVVVVRQTVILGCRELNWIRCHFLIEFSSCNEIINAVVWWVGGYDSSTPPHPHPPSSSSFSSAWFCYYLGCFDHVFAVVLWPETLVQPSTLQNSSYL